MNYITTAFSNFFTAWGNLITGIIDGTIPFWAIPFMVGLVIMVTGWYMLLKFWPVTILVMIIMSGKEKIATQNNMEGVAVQQATQQGTQAAKEKDAASGHC